jgi:hypothetical protein
MNERLPEELIERMRSSLRELAETIGDEVDPDVDALKGILSRVGLDKDGRALSELSQWHEILMNVRNCPDSNEEREKAIVALQERGMPEAPATLAVERATAPPDALTSEPDSIDFGLLRSGEAANATLKVSGVLRSAEPRDKRLTVTLFRSGPKETLVKIMVKAGQSGGSLNDEMILRGRRVEIRVPVTARWIMKEPPMPEEPRGPQPLKVCPICKEKSLFWNWLDKTWGCLNVKCPDYYQAKESRRPP